MSFKIEISPESADEVRDWLLTRGGVAIWKSVNLSNPSGQWLTPATIALKDLEDSGLKANLLKELGDENALVGYPRPNWQCDSKPSEIVSDPKDCAITTYRTVKTLRIALRMGSQGLSIKLTDHSSRKVREACERFEDARYIFGGDDGRDCYIQVPDQTVPLIQ